MGFFADESGPEIIEVNGLSEQQVHDLYSEKLLPGQILINRFGPGRWDYYVGTGNGGYEKTPMYKYENKGTNWLTKLGNAIESIPIVGDVIAASEKPVTSIISGLGNMNEQDAKDALHAAGLIAATYGAAGGFSGGAAAAGEGAGAGTAAGVGAGEAADLAAGAGSLSSAGMTYPEFTATLGSPAYMEGAAGTLPSYINAGTGTAGAGVGGTALTYGGGTASGTAVAGTGTTPAVGVLGGSTPATAGGGGGLLTSNTATGLLAATNLAGAYLGYKGAGEAADATKEAADKATAAQLQMYFDSVARSAPWTQAGTKAVGNVIDMVEKGPGTFVPSEQPGYQFGYKEFVEKPLLQRASAMGNLRSGNLLRALSDRASDYASTQYDSWLNRWLNTKVNPNLAIAGLGQTSNNMLTSAGNYTGAGMANNILTGGQGQAIGAINQANALTGGLKGATSSIFDIALLNRLAGGNLFDKPQNTEYTLG